MKLIEFTSVRIPHHHHHRCCLFAGPLKGLCFCLVHKYQWTIVPLKMSRKRIEKKNSKENEQRSQWMKMSLTVSAFNLMSLLTKEGNATLRENEKQNRTVTH